LKRSFRKIVGIPFTFGTTWLTCGPHVTRYNMYSTLAAVMKEEHSEGTGKTILAISHSADFVHILGLKKATIIEANFPEHDAVNLKAFSDGEFDFVISDQVLEHVQGNPQDVFSESLRLLKPGGIAVHTTCFVYPVHAAPSDFWRFTPNGLKYLARHFSEILEVGGFGNRGIWVVDFLGLIYTPVPHANWHPLHLVANTNNLQWPVVTWIVARK